VARETSLRSGPWVRRGLIALIVVAVYGAAGFFLAPWLIERTLIGTLSERLALDTEVARVRLNPFALSLTVDDLAVTETDGQPLIAFEQFYVNFQLASLIRWAWSFDEIHLTRPAFRFERITESETNFGALADRWASTAGAADPEPASSEPGQIPRLVIADLKIIDGRLTIVDRTPNEPFSTDLSPIDLGVMDLSTLPDQSGTQQVTIRTESGAELGWTGSLSVIPLALAGEIRLQGTYTPVLFRYFRDELALPLGFEGGTVSARLDYLIEMDDQGVLTARMENLESTLRGLQVSQPDHPELVQVGSLSMSGGRLLWPERIVHLDRVDIDAVLIQAFRGADGSYLPASTAAEATVPEATAPSPSATAVRSAEAPTVDPGNGADGSDAWQVSIAVIDLSGWQLTHIDTTLDDARLELRDFGLTLNDFALTDGQSMPLAMSLTLAPTGALELSGQLRLFPDPGFAGSLTGTGLAIAAAQPYLSRVADIDLEDGSISFSGALTAGGETPFEYRGDFRLEDLLLNDRARKERLFSWDRLSADKLVATPSALEISLLSLEAPYARVSIDRDGSSNIQRTLAVEPAGSSQADAPSADGPSNGSPAEFHVIVGKTEISNGSSRFTDLALPLPFDAEVSAISGRISTLATNSREPARVEINGQVNEYGQLNIDGSISAFAPTENTDISIDFDNINLPSVSPYTIKFAGRAIAEGRTDLTLSYRLEDGEVNGANRMVIRDLMLGEKVDQPGAMDLPLDMAVALLKDGEGKVDLSFPVSGSVDDPEFSYSGAVTKALSNVIGGIVAAPFRLLGSLVGMAPDELEHVGFEPGESTITPPQRETLSKLTDALMQRPQLVLEVAPVVSSDADRRAMAETLVDEAIAGRIAGNPDSDLTHLELQRRVLEAMYDSAGLQPARNTVAEAHRAEDASGASQLDVPAYAADLREALIVAWEVSEPDLTALGLARLEAIRAALTDQATLSEERVKTLPAEAVELNEDGLVQMSLNVTIAD
jgi:hypothetical protein